MKKVAIILSGCGVYDGAEIHESVLAMLALARNGLEYSLFAPDKEQAHVINHLTGEVMSETRNVLTEAARIARGDISALQELDPEDFDAILLPGGFGVAKNLSSFAFDGADMVVDPQVAALIKAFADSKKVIGALCIAPTVVAKVLSKVEVTIGEDETTASAIEAMGAKHTPADYTEVVMDPEQRVVTGPCYMLDSTISQIAENTDNVVKAMIELM
ncbi:isoprenoid biosynthesis glyoxalase ElbB [Saccharicrinis sp. FJH54]|uniref:isoprenoid biosynthesis glyoxalase ElbB n=1 Tax=Saccharicrinis sp. FJH54 TaxID=3344665 RepID=UPI0035D43C66